MKELAKKYKLKIAVTLFFLVYLGSSRSALSFPVAEQLYSNSEGLTSEKHDHSLEQLRQKYFYNYQALKAAPALDEKKLDQLILFLSQKIEDLSSSAKMNKKTNLIFVHGYSEEKAEKKALKAIDEEADTIAPLLFAKEHAQRLKADYKTLNALQIHERVETTLLFLVTGYTIYPSSILDRLQNAAQSVLHSYFLLNKSSAVGADGEKSTEASNLMWQGRFLSPQEINKWKQENKDISKLDPPSSAFWTNTDVQSYDPADENYQIQKGIKINHLFPPKTESVPEFYYDRMGQGTIKIKSYWLDKNDLDKEGKAKKKNVSLRVGWESMTTSVVNHLARMLGYAANPTTARKKVKLILDKTSLEEFLAQWKIVHGLQMGSPLSYIERIPNENSVYLHNVTLEAYPNEEKYRKMGPFRMGDNGFSNRREYRGMMMYNALIGLADQYEYQSRADAFYDPQTKLWQPLFLIADTGWSLGLPSIGNVGNVNEFTPWFTKRWNDHVFIFWLSLFDYRAWKSVTYSDAKWMARRIAEITPQQIEKIFYISNYQSDFFTRKGQLDPVVALYVNKFKARVNQMILDFDLDKEGYQQHVIKSATSLAASYPEYISQEGLLKENGDNIPENPAKFLGNDFSVLQLVTVKALNGFQNKLYGLLDPSKYFASSFSEGAEEKATNEWSIDLGHWHSDAAKGIVTPLFQAKRYVQVNQELGANQKRYLLKDRLTLSLPIGINNDKLTTPVQLYKTYSWEYIHSVTTKAETIRERFFKAINPFALKEIKEQLDVGEQLYLSTSYGGSVGRAKVKAMDNIELQLALLGFGSYINQTWYFAKPNPDYLEVMFDQQEQTSFNQGFDVQALLRLAFMWNAQQRQRNYKMFRIDLASIKNQGLRAWDPYNKAFLAAIKDQDLTLLNQLVHPIELQSKQQAYGIDTGFLLWNSSHQNEAEAFKINDRQFILVNQSHTSDRAFDRLWTEKLTNKMDSSFEFTNPVNFFARYWDEGERMDFNIEGELDKAKRDWKNLEINISFTKLDQQCFRSEFEKEFKPFFANRIQRPIPFQMPEGINVYPNILGTQRWQISAKAIVDVLQFAAHIENLEYLKPNSQPRARDTRPVYDPRYSIVSRANKLLSSLSSSILNQNDNSNVSSAGDSKGVKNNRGCNSRTACDQAGSDQSMDSLIQQKQAEAEDLAFVFKEVIGSQGQHVAKILSIVDINDIWVITKISRMLELSHPTFRTQKGDDYWAPEIGHYQGESYLKTVRKKLLIEPLLQEISN